MMRRMNIVVWGAACLFGLAAMAGAECVVTDLRCEYLLNPLGIDSTQPRLSWRLESPLRGEKQSAYQVLVADSEQALNADQGALWDSGRVDSDQSIQVVYAGQPLASRTACFWKVRVWDKDGNVSAWSATASWTMGLLAADDWQGAWIGADWMENNAGPLPWFRKEIDLSETPRRAVAYVCALGYYELFINGQKVGDAVLTPAVSDYSKRGLYLTHDVTKYLKPGPNCIALWLGRGWSTKMLEPASTAGPLVKAQVEIDTESAPRKIVPTDASWKMQKSCITPLGSGADGDYGGEQYDARAEITGWNTAGFDDASWTQAKIHTPPTPLLAAQMVEPNRFIETIKPVEIKPFGDGYLVDMGKCFSGWMEMRFPAQAQAGKPIEMRYAEKIFPDNALQTYNQRDAYIPRDGVEGLFCSRFNYHAFRWVYLIGLSQAPSKDDMTGRAISTDYAPASQFVCSNPLLNDIYRTVLWTYRCLSLSGYTVDCPQRERLGYGGDSGTSMEAGMMNFKVAGFYSKWAADWRDAQNAEGDVPYIAPFPHGAGGGPAWSGFCITLPWQIYLQYGDQRILELGYPVMKRWLAFIDTKVRDGLLEHYVGIGNDQAIWSFLGDWVPPNREQGADRVDDLSTRFFNNCYYLYCLQIMSKISTILGHEADAARYKEQAGALAPRLHEKFLNPGEATYVNREQPYLAMPLLFGVTPEPLRPNVLKNLEQDILVTKQGHLNTGMHGTYFMTKYCIEQFRNDLIYSIVSQDTYPSWGYMLKNGATTIWEEWDGENSQIHNTMISIGLWFIEGVGGIRYTEDHPGFKHFIVSPGIVEPLTFAKTSFQSPFGRIVSNWTREDNTVRLELVVPPNSAATVILPAANEKAITESGRGLSEQSGISQVEYREGRSFCRVEAGAYQFESLLK